MSDGLVSTEFTIAIRNVGGDGGPATARVVMRIDEGQPERIHELNRPPSGDASEFVVSQDLALGQHTVSFGIEGAEQTLDVDVKVADITIEPVSHFVVSDGSVELIVRVTNQGDLLARNINVSANWEDDKSGTEGDSEPKLALSVIDSMEPGESRIVYLPIEIPTGTYTLELSLETETLEVELGNNRAELGVAFDYVRLIPSMESKEIVGYERNGEGIVEVMLLVKNMGEAPSGPIIIGLACRDVTIEGCSQEYEIGSIPPGTSTPVHATLTLPQGETQLTMFAGANEDGYLWGDENVEQATINVPHKPAVSLSLSADADVNGYWSDGTANVELTMSLLNDGYSEFEGPQAVAIACVKDGNALGGCGEEASLDLTDGFGPAVSTYLLRVPMGVALEVNLDTDGHETLKFVVPERILGVNGDVWECFGDRRGFGQTEGCGGWFNEMIYKWNQAEPVKVWATGDADYVEIFLKILEDFSPVLNLEFEVVDAKEESYFKAYMGVPSSTALELGWPSCEDKGGCSSRQVSSSGLVKFGTNGVWHRGEISNVHDYGSVRGTILHEALHALVPIAHRHTLDALMGSYGRISTFDEALIRLNAHPLLEAGMTMSEVRELIVLNEELLDPQPPSPYEEAWPIVSSAVDTLQEARSVRFSISGRWSGSCGGHSFGPATYEFDDIDGASAGLVRYEDRTDHFVILELSDTWKEVRGSWQKSTRREAQEATSWYHQYSTPFYAITNILTPTNDDEVKIVERADGRVVLEGTIDRTTSKRQVSLAIDEETHMIVGYTVKRLVQPGTCTYEIEATDGEYGIVIPVPEEIRNAESDS